MKRFEKLKMGVKKSQDIKDRVTTTLDISDAITGGRVKPALIGAGRTVARASTGVAKAALKARRFI